MLKAEKKQAMGRGLGALFQKSEQKMPLQEIELTKISANPQQPRRNFNAEDLQELAQSIKENGLFQPIIVRPKEDGYEIIAGERRYRAAKMAGLLRIMAIVRHCSDQQMAMLALIENLQREDLNVIEEAQAYEELAQKYELRQEDLAKSVGKSRSHIANCLRILHLAPFVRQLLAEKKISMGQARPLLALSQKEQVEMVNLIVKNDLSARTVEEMIKKKKKAHPAKKAQAPDVFVREAQDKLKLFFGAPVRIKNKGKKNTIEIDFKNNEDLENIIATLMQALEQGKNDGEIKNFTI